MWCWDSELGEGCWLGRGGQPQSTECPAALRPTSCTVEPPSSNKRWDSACTSLCMELESLGLSKTCQKEKDRYRLVSFQWCREKKNKEVGSMGWQALGLRWQSSDHPAVGEGREGQWRSDKRKQKDNVKSVGHFKGYRKYNFKTIFFRFLGPT